MDIILNAKLNAYTKVSPNDSNLSQILQAPLDVPIDLNIVDSLTNNKVYAIRKQITITKNQDIELLQNCNMIYDYNVAISYEDDEDKIIDINANNQFQIRIINNVAILSVFDYVLQQLGENEITIDLYIIYS